MWARALLVAVALGVYTFAAPDPSKRANPVVQLDDAVSSAKPMTWNEC